VRATTRQALVDRLSAYDAVVEIGIGNRSVVAGALADRGVDVTATDLRDCECPPEVRFVRDDITDPEKAIYEGAGAIYGLNLPPELHRPAAMLATGVDSDLLFTTLGTDPPTVPVVRETIPGETIFVFDPNATSKGC